jgi:hypothetical protein
MGRSSYTDDQYRAAIAAEARAHVHYTATSLTQAIGLGARRRNTLVRDVVVARSDGRLVPRADVVPGQTVREVRSRSVLCSDDQLRSVALDALATRHVYSVYELLQIMRETGCGAGRTRLDDVLRGAVTTDDQGRLVPVPCAPEIPGESVSDAARQIAAEAEDRARAVQVRLDGLADAAACGAEALRAVAADIQRARSELERIRGELVSAHHTIVDADDASSPAPAPATKPGRGRPRADATPRIQAILYAADTQELRSWNDLLRAVGGKTTKTLQLAKELLEYNSAGRLVPVPCAPEIPGESVSDAARQIALHQARRCAARICDD